MQKESCHVQLDQVYFIHGLAERLDSIEKKQDEILEKVGAIMANLDQVLEEIAAEDTIIDSVVVLLEGIKKQLDDVLSGANLPPAVQAKVDAVLSGVLKNRIQLEDALLANTPSEPNP